MKSIRLQNLTLTNFKGVKNFALNTGGLDTRVHGDNGAGKTTLFDAFTWLLFGRDSLNQAVFEIKTLTPSGEPQHNLQHTVEATLNVDGAPLTLRKTYSEKWTKKRGNPTNTFTGHTTDHFADGVPVTKKEFGERVARVLDENVARLLTDPAYFTSVLHWEDRRALLLEVCGDVTDNDVIKSSDALAGLPGILGKRTLEEHRKVAQARRAEINRELQRIPVRIDEVTRGLPAVPAPSPTAIKASLEDATRVLDELRAERARVLGGDQLAAEERELRGIEDELLALRRGAAAKADAGMGTLRRARAEATERQSGIVNELARHERRAEQSRIDAACARETANALRISWRAAQAEKPDADVQRECPACHQALPEDQVAAALAEANERHAELLTRIAADGRARNAEAEQADSDRGITEETIKRLKEEQAAAKTEIRKLSAAIADLQDDPHSEGEGALLARKATVEERIRGLRAGNDAALEDLGRREGEGALLARDLETELAEHAAIQRGETRIRELAATEKTLATEYENLERQLHTVDEFTRAKVRLLEDRINAKFQLARFKLFTELVNGGLVETCEVTCGGVPFDSLNHGTRVNTGLDLIRTLQAHYGVHAPVWVDQAEAVTALLPMDCQTIALVVSAEDPTLRIETLEEVTA